MTEIVQEITGNSTEKGKIVKIRVPHKIQRQVTHAPHEVHYPTKDLIEELPPEIGPVAWVPRTYFHGIQTQEEYHGNHYKQVLAIKAFEENPLGYLDQNPVLTCLVPFGEGNSQLIVIDGHNRIIQSGRVAVKDDDGEHKAYDRIPTRIFTPDQMADLLNKSGHTLNGKPKGQAYTGDSLSGQLLEFASEVEQELEHEANLPESKRPVILHAVTSIDQLIEKYGQKPNVLQTSKE